MEQLQIETVVINNKNYFTFLLIFFFGGSLLFLLLAIKLSSFIVLGIGIFTIFFSPLIFQRAFRERFSKNAVLRFDSNQFSVDLISRKTGVLDTHDDFKFEEISSFKASDSAKDDSAFVKLFLKDGRTAYYTFLGQGEENGKDVIEVLAKFIKAYNETQQKGKKITPVPVLMATKKVKYYIVGLTLLLIIAVIVQLIYHPKSIPISLLSGASLYLLILLQRKRGLEQLNRMK
jgi:hypothetical protein